jgi:hypothetical protein
MKSVNRSRVLSGLEISVPTADGDEMLFRIEVLEKKAGTTRAFRCRLYRLESFRLRVREQGSKSKRARWGEADYRCWVVDDNLDVESHSYPTASMAQKATLQTLRSQLGI